MEKKSQFSSTEAVFLGALAPGVNGPTWNTLRFAFLLLGLCLAFMLSVAFTSGQSMLLVHVGFLIVIASTLFILLNWYDSNIFLYIAVILKLKVFLLHCFNEFLAQTGLVQVETQMQELNLLPNDKTK
ncbi:hypothetical protein AtEden1_Chr1g0030541 [Arabidopsis thaliana]